MKLVIQGGQMKIEADRTELIKLAAEMLTLAALPEYPNPNDVPMKMADKAFDPQSSCSPCHFLLDGIGPVNDHIHMFFFVRAREELPRRDEEIYEALNAG